MSLITAQILKLQDITPTVREFTLGLDKPVSWAPGAHIQVHLYSQNCSLVRHYSLLPSTHSNELRIAVKRQDPGQGGSKAMWQLLQGNTLAISAPQQDFSLDLNAPEYLLIAGGIGITPLVSMAYRLLQRAAQFKLLYAVQQVQELAYADELQASLGDRLITQLGLMTDLAERIAALPDQAQAYVCGPFGLLQAAQKIWRDQGRAAHLLRFENFGSSPASTDFQIHLPRHSLEIPVSAGQSALQAIQQAGVQTMFGCLRGQCGLCVTRVLALDGEIEHRDVFLSDAQKLGNAQICICVSRVKGKITLDSAYRPDTLPRTQSTAAIPVCETAAS
jgi:ferredoxin-NADP reductase